MNAIYDGVERGNIGVPADEPSRPWTLSRQIDELEAGLFEY